MPRPEELFNAVQGGKYFTKLDLSQAYNQIPLSAESSALTTLSTHKGLYRWLRLPFGIASSPAIFQNSMHKILSGLKGVVCYLDDILVSGQSEMEHAANLKSVLKKLTEYGLRGR